MATPVPPPGSRPPVRADELSEPFDPTRVDVAPRTGHPDVDRALDGVVRLADEPLVDHPDRLARAHEALHAQLQGPPDDAAR